MLYAKKLQPACLMFITHCTVVGGMCYALVCVADTVLTSFISLQVAILADEHVARPINFIFDV